LVGPNASGKTTFLDVVGFLGDLVKDGIDVAVQNRTSNFEDLLWKQSGNRFELAIEARIPEEKRKLLKDPELDTVRYEVALGVARPPSNEIVIASESVLLLKSREAESPRRSLFPSPPAPPNTIMSPDRLKNGSKRRVLKKLARGHDTFYSEVHPKSGKGWIPSFKLGARKSTLGNLPEDETRFPVATWLKNLLTDGVQHLNLNSLLMRKASPPGRTRRFIPDGSNLPWVIAALREQNPASFADWLEHVKTALEDVEDIRTIEREDDKHRYLIIRYRGGINVPSWMSSDGTLRFLALTLPAYLQGFSGTYLIEEPENGIHPRAVDALFKSLSSVYDAQILLASHSPVILSMVDLEKVLCFAKTSDGATDIVSGKDHPKLRDWQGEVMLGDLFATGILG
jgi:predicted ATPase